MKDNLKKLCDILKSAGYAVVGTTDAALDGAVNLSLEVPLPLKDSKGIDQRPDPFEPVKAALGKSGLVCASLALFPAVPRSAVVVRSIQLDAGTPRK